MKKQEDILRSRPINNTIFVAVFGAFWGISESTLGSFLHLVQFPLSGLLLGQLGMLILLNASRLHYRKGNIILMGMIAALIKAVAIATVKIGPIIGIMSEAVLIELMLSVFGSRRSVFIASGMLVSMIPAVMKIVTKTIYLGMSFLEYLVDFIDYLSELFGFAAGWYLVGLYILIHLSTGAVAGWLSWKISSDIQRRLQSS